MHQQSCQLAEKLNTSKMWDEFEDAKAGMYICPPTPGSGAGSPSYLPEVEDSSSLDGFGGGMGF
jgi:hypothetical protein